MANGHVEIHDPLSNPNDLATISNSDPKSTSDTNNMDDTMEFRLLMAYTKRRRPTRHILVGQSADPNGSSSPQTLVKTEKEEEEKPKKKKKKGGKRLLRILSCIKHQVKDDEQPQTVAVEADAEYRCCDFNVEVEEEDKLDEAASRLTEIADEIPFTPPDVEVDSEQDDVEKVIGLLLKEAGDRLNEETLKNANIAAELFWNYSFFEKLIKTLLIRMGLMNPEPDALGPQASPKSQIAVTCEVTSRLSDVNTLPMSRMLYHGARYLQDHYSSWIQQHGGYEEAFHSDDEDEVE